MAFNSYFQYKLRPFAYWIAGLLKTN